MVAVEVESHNEDPSYSVILCHTPSNHQVETRTTVGGGVYNARPPPS